MHTKEIDQPTEVKDFMVNFALNPTGMLLLAGMNGTGKSFASRAVFDDFNPPMSTMEFDDKIFTSQASLNIKWQEVMNKYSTTLYLLKKFCYPKLLILDDIGTRTPSEAFLDFLYAIIDYRYENRHNRGTIVTTNLTSELMRLKFGDAFVSRAGGGKIFRLEGKDRRNINF